MNFSNSFISKAKDKGNHAPWRVWISDEKLVFASLISPSKSVCLRSYIKHSSQCFIPISKTSKFVKNTPLRIVFSTLFSVLDMWWNTVSRVWYITSTPTNDLRVLLLPIITTATTGWPQKIRNSTTVDRTNSTRTWLFDFVEPHFFCFLKGPLQWLAAVKSEMVGWILNFKRAILCWVYDVIFLLMQLDPALYVVLGHFLNGKWCQSEAELRV